MSRKFSLHVVMPCALVLGLMAASVAQAVETTDIRPLPPFSQIDLRTSVEATFAVASKPSITLSGPADTLQRVTTEVQDGRLIVCFKHDFTHGDSISNPIHVAIVGPFVQAVSFSGSGSLKLDHPAADPLAIDVSSLGSVIATGRASSLNIDISGAGVVDTRALSAHDLTVSVSGSGDVRAQASAQATVDISGSGHVQVGGHPARHIADVSGSGTVDFD